MHVCVCCVRVYVYYMCICIVYVSIHTMKYCPVFRKKEILSFVTTWMNLEHTV
jgi:hypothetical protein